MAQDMQDAGNVSAELDAMVCDLIGAFLDAPGGGREPGRGRGDRGRCFQPLSGGAR